MTKDAIIAVKRFGLGAKPGELARARSDPRGYLLAQLEDSNALVFEGELPSSKEIWIEWRRYSIALRRTERRRKGVGRVSEEYAGRTFVPSPAVPKNEVAETMARVRMAVSTSTPFLERLAAFWANHFCVSVHKSSLVRNLAGAYEREAIRPNMLGRFEDLLGAVVRHPAMLSFLDNSDSIGPNSAAGKKRGRGLNENLAREALELHTIGVASGYDQSDVTSFARALTGWSVGGVGSDAAGQFKFEPRYHEPGPATVMGRVYPQDGEEQAAAILKDLVAHSKTAEHVAGKLARYFVSESAPPSLVEGLAKTFRDTGGNLRSVAEALVSAEESWTPRRAKIVPPYDLLVSAFRATQVVPSWRFVNRSLRTFGQLMWGVDSPAGWPDDDMAWAAPDAILERIDWAERAATELDDRAPNDPLGLAEDVLGEALTEETRKAIIRAESKKQALALLFISPEFQRR